MVYDRDPRNFDRALSREDVLNRMDLCNYFVAVISEHFTRRVGSGDLASASAVTHEWEHARARARHGQMRLTGIWHSGEALPPPFEEAAVMDLRVLHVPDFWGSLDLHFPDVGDGQRPFRPPVVAPPQAQGLLHRSGNLIADRYRLVVFFAWKADGSCDRTGPLLIRQLERMTAQLAASGRYTHFTTEPASSASDD